MADIGLEEGEEVSANSELRIIVLELMKMAIQRKKPFSEVAKEYIKNVYLLRQMLDAQKD